jgi:hypothetical protein
MAWDQTRPVPWRRLVRDWLLYVGVMTVFLTVVYRDRMTAGLLGGLLASGPIFVLIGAGLAKLGYQRKTMRQLRAEAAARDASRSAGGTAGATVAAPGPRPKPAPTRRTSGGGSRPAPRKKR